MDHRTSGCQRGQVDLNLLCRVRTLEHAPPERVGAGTGLYNGLAVIIGAAGGTWLVGKVVEVTGSYDAGLTVVVVAGLANAVVLAILARRIRY